MEDLMNPVYILKSLVWNHDDREAKIRDPDAAVWAVAPIEDVWREMPDQRVFDLDRPEGLDSFV